MSMTRLMRGGTRHLVISVVLVPILSLLCASLAGDGILLPLYICRILSWMQGFEAFLFNYVALSVPERMPIWIDGASWRNVSHSGRPLQSWAWGWLERVATGNRDPRHDAEGDSKIPEILANSSLPWLERERALCSQFIELSQEWTRPVIIRGVVSERDSAPMRFWKAAMSKDFDSAGAKESGETAGTSETSTSEKLDTTTISFDKLDTMTINFLIRTLSEDSQLDEALRVSLLSYNDMYTNWETILDRPEARKDSLHYRDFAKALSMLRNTSSNSYMAFNTAILQRLRIAEEAVVGKSFYAWDTRILNFCTSTHGPLGFSGYGSEVFVGSGKRVGSPLHAAYMDNLFLNLHGVRDVALISPSYSQFVRPLFGAGYVTAFRAHKKWAPDESEDGESPFQWSKKLDHVEKVEFTMNEGDMLFIPAWWWHAIANSDRKHGTAMAALSHRGHHFRRNPRLSFLDNLKFSPTFRAFSSVAPADIAVSDWSQTAILAWFWPAALSNPRGVQWTQATKSAG